MKSRSLHQTLALACILLGLAVGPAVRADVPAWSASSLGGQIAWSADQPLSAVITVGSAPVTHILIDTTLSDEVTATRFAAGDFQLCAKQTGDCMPIDRLEPQSVTKVFLRPVHAPAPGKYSGTVMFVAQEGRTTPIQLTVFVSDACSRLIGAGMIVLGTVLSFGITLGVRNQLTIAQFMAPAAELHDRFVQLRAALTSTLGKDDAPRVQALVTGWISALRTKELQRNGLVPQAWSVAMPQAKTAEYQSLLDSGGGWVLAVDHLTKIGFAPLAKDLAQPGPDKPKIHSLVTKIDALAPQVFDTSLAAPALPALDTEIQAIVAQAGAGLRVRASEPLESERYQYRIAALAC